MKGEKLPYDQNSKSYRKKKYIINIALTTSFFCGAILLIFEINLYRNTLINWAIPTTIFLVSGLIAILPTSTLLEKYYRTRHFFLKLVYNIVAFGGITVYSFIAVNYYFPDSKEDHYKVEIIKTGHLAKGKNGCGPAYAKVEINNADKELIFPCGFELEGYRFVNLTIKKGFLGFEIITSKKATIE